MNQTIIDTWLVFINLFNTCVVVINDFQELSHNLVMKGPVETCKSKGHVLRCIRAPNLWLGRSLWLTWHINIHLFCGEVQFRWIDNKSSGQVFTSFIIIEKTWHLTLVCSMFSTCIQKHLIIIPNTPMCYTRVILYYIIYLKWLLIITNGVMLTHNKCDTSRPLDNLVKPFQWVYMALITINSIERDRVSNTNSMVKLVKGVVFWAIRCSQLTFNLYGCHAS